MDAEELARLSQYSWHAHKANGKWYAARNVRIGPEGKKTKTVKIRMHNFLLSGMRVDHKNGDGLDNRRENLRVCNQQQNTSNSKKPITNTSGFKGVTWSKERNKWAAQIMVKQKHLHLGYFVFDDLEKAARAYDRAAIKYFGEFANLNFKAAPSGELPTSRPDPFKGESACGN